ncbi:hypothetical protein [Xanthocytophaga agilis]|uniref:Uncharacterized protein n=1 Tax=Xanthocytophaga agilis TaxID=3048010 RepID=A0AAE3UJ30_9BACT|nr:hypothetical protein [Xanthocytophaga agilis]MDJ1505322.1 hypothetical protein [Xanthocytophaga agilis]
MSYDITITLTQPRLRTDIMQILHQNPAVQQFRFVIHSSHYMEIDLEPSTTDPEQIAGVSFHIPYSFLNHVNTNFDLYFHYISTIATQLCCRAYDPQLGCYLDEPTFQLRKPLFRQTALPLGQLIYQDGKLHIEQAYSHKQLIWDIFSGIFVGSQAGESTKADKSPPVDETTEFIIYADARKKTIQVIDKETGTVRQNLEKAGETLLIKAISRTQFLSVNKGRAIKCWDMVTDQCLRTFKGHLDTISDCLLVHNRILFSSSLGGSLLVWNFITGKLLLTILHSAFNQSWIAFDTQGNFDHSENFFGAVQWDFGKQQFSERLCLAVDTRGSYQYKPVISGQFISGLVQSQMKSLLTQSLD